VIVQGLEYKDEITRIKIGICGCRRKKFQECPNCLHPLEDNKQTESLDKRLSDHRTLWPQLQVKFVVYDDDAELLEKCMKRLYHKQINPGGHEIIEGVSLEEVIEQTKGFLDLFNLYDKENKKYCIEENIEQYNKNTLTHMKDGIKKIREVIEEKEEKVDEIKDEIKKAEKNIVEINNEIDEYKNYLAKSIAEYKDVELREILSKLKLVKSGDKQSKYNRMVKYLKEKLEEEVVNDNHEDNEDDEGEDEEDELPKRQCKMCKKDKVLSFDNFQPFATSGFKHECRECVITRYSEIVKKEVREDKKTEIDESVGTKKCFRCMEILSKMDFCKSNKTKDGLNSICKNCDHDRKYGEKASRLIKERPKDVPKDHKWCPTCETTKPKTEYFKALKRPDGVQNNCKRCDGKARVARSVLKNAKLPIKSG
jgi:hypothetical protein